MKELAWVLFITLAIFAGLFFLGQEIRRRSCPCANACVNNLRQLDGAAQEWALEYKQPDTAIVRLSDLTPYIKLTPDGKLPPCPKGGTYSASWAVSNHPTCSLSTATPPHILP
jgi:hypothetical protein